jgi:ABC-type nitrate/sulfonate/bicarbonate transport system substrate-binding protein
LEATDLLETNQLKEKLMTRNRVLTVLAVIIAIVGAAAIFLNKKPGVNNSLRVAISPYQDLAMLTAHDHLGLDTKYGTRIEIVTLAWEDVVPSLASAGRTVDVGYGSLIEFLTKYENINKDSSDPLVYVFPTYVFKGGGFVSFNKDVPSLDAAGKPSKQQMHDFLKYRIGAQKNSMFDMMVFTLAKDAEIAIKDLRVTDTTMADGLLAAQAGSLDIVAAGLTQRNEALERGGRIVLTMDKLGFADLTGLICKRSTLETRRKDIENLVRIWFDCVDFIYTDIDKNSKIPLEYLKKTSSTQYTVESYKRALEAEYLPRSVSEAQKELVASTGSFSIQKISTSVSGYLVTFGITKTSPPVPTPIEVKP